MQTQSATFTVPASNRAEATERHWPAGWWLFPAVLAGAAMWVGIFRLVTLAF